LKAEQIVESGTWIVLGSLFVIVLMAYFGRMPRAAGAPAAESLSKRWFGAKSRVS
jgi:hypothetical protein